MIGGCSSFFTLMVHEEDQDALLTRNKLTHTASKSERNELFQTMAMCESQMGTPNAKDEA